MIDPVYQKLIETSWRRELTPEEQARLQSCLSARPETEADWRTERALNQLLRELPNPPLASNFTARVLRAAEAEQGRRERRSRWAKWWEDWIRVVLPKAAWAGLALLLAGGGLHQYHSLTRARIARDLAKIPVVLTLPDPKALIDFEPIRQFSRVSHPAGRAETFSDDDLLKALQ